MLEESNKMGIINTFDMEKFSDKESLMDIMYTMSKKAGISDKDYRMWYKLNEDTEIAVRTSVGESKTELVKNSVGQGSFGAALASSINIGCIERKEIHIHRAPRPELPHNAGRHSQSKHKSGGGKARL